MGGLKFFSCLCRWWSWALNEACPYHHCGLGTSGSKSQPRKRGDRPSGAPLNLLPVSPSPFFSLNCRAL